MDLDEPDETVTITVLPHTADVVREYCATASLDTDVSLDSLPTEMDETDTTLTRKEFFDIGTTLLNVDERQLRAEHYGRRIMRKVHTEINT
jgi:hypothetical protein